MHFLIGILIAIIVFVFVLRYLWFAVPVGMLIYYFAKGKKQYSVGKMVAAGALCLFSFIVFISGSDSISEPQSIQPASMVNNTFASEDTSRSQTPLPQAESSTNTEEEEQRRLEEQSRIEEEEKRRLEEQLRIEEEEKLNAEINADAVDAFVTLVTELPETASDARGSFDVTKESYATLTQEQREMIPDEIRNKYNNLSVEISRIENRERIDGTQIVISATGTKYHYPSCRTLTYAGTPTTVARARSLGYGPCGVCDPPS